LRHEPVVYGEENKRRDAASTLQGRRAVPALDQQAGRAVPALSNESTQVWQKESFDHIVRSPDSLEKFRDYIRSHKTDELSSLVISEDLRRDAAATMVHEACAPFDSPELRDALVKAKQDAEQVIDTTTIDTVIETGFDAVAKEKAQNILNSFRDYIEQHQAEITALQILYSRPYKQRLTETMVKEFEQKLRDSFGPMPVATLWRACEQVSAFKQQSGSNKSGSGVSPLKSRDGSSTLQQGGSGVSPLEKPRQRRDAVATFADLVALVRFALEQQPVLKPFSETVYERFDAWLKAKQSGSGVSPLKSRDGSSTLEQPKQSGSGVSPLKSRDGSSTFTSDQLAWLYLIRDHIATSLSIEPEDLDLSPFNQQGGLGKAHQLFGDQLPKLLEELNEALVA
jgi:type I restriction enzyme R subunit